MTCLEAQSKIIAYIDYNLERDEKQEFLKHIQSCENCKEELNIYYTMIEGMRQLDENIPLSTDFTQELDVRMAHEMATNRKKKNLFRSSMILAFVTAFGFLVFGYVNFLNLLHEQEQAQIKQAQGDFYYSDTFDAVIFYPDGEEPVMNINIEPQEENTSFYKKIRQYQVLNTSTE